MQPKSALPNVDHLDMFQAILEGIDDAVAVKDTSGRYILVNTAGARFVGKSPKEILGKTDFELFPEDRALEMAERDRVVVVRGTPVSFEDKECIGGIDRAFVTTIGPWYDPSGTALGVFGMTREITDQKRIEKWLVENEKRFRAMIENSSDCIALLDAEGGVLYASPATTRVLGYSVDEFVGLNALSLIHPDEFERMRKHFSNLIKDPGGSFTTEFRYRHHDGSWKWMEGTATNLLREPGVRAIVTNYRDIDERKQKEELRKQMLEQSLRSEKMEAIGRLASGITHEFNNVFTIILGYCDLLGGSHYPVANLPRDLGRIQRTVERGTTLTKQLLGLASKQKTIAVDLDLNIELMKIETMLPALLHENVKLVLYLTRQPAMIKADLNLIHQLVVNLAVNALEAMPERGHLTIETSNIEFHEPHVTRSGIVPPGSYVCLRLKDTGRGMTPDVISHLYEPFFSTKPREKHSGLGLATAYGIVHQSGGYIDASSEPGRGTTFEIYFPRVDSVTRPDPANQGSVRGSETIMLVEDDVVLREVVVEYLTSLGYFVLEAHDCANALELCQQHSSAVDLLITDVVMPDMNGPTLAENVRDLLPKIKVLFMSGYPSADVQRAESVASKLNFLAKPFNASELGAKVRAILDSE